LSFDITVYQPKIGTILDTIFYEIAQIEITVIGYSETPAQFQESSTAENL